MGYDKEQSRYDRRLLEISSFALVNSVSSKPGNTNA
jgi:hypothetical protein